MSENKIVENIVICDIDGTIADGRDRDHYLDGDKKDWKSYFAKISTDTLRSVVLEDVFRAVQANSARVVFVTARPESYRDVTVKWLKEVAGVVGADLYMRPAGDFRPDTEIKSEILDRELSQYNIVKVFDDRPSVVRMWQSRGLDVVDVGKGIEF